MNKAFNDFLSSIASGASGDGGPNMKNYQHATKLYVDGGYARAPKFNHLYFVGFNINDKVVRDPGWLQSGVNEVGLLVKSASLPKFKISTEQMNQYNRKTQVQTKLNYEAVSMEFHDDNSEITNGLWKNYYRYYYTDSIYGGKDDSVSPSPSQVSLGKKLFGGLLSPGRKRIKSMDPSTVPEAYTNNKYKVSTYPYGLDNLQTVPFFKSIDIFVLYQQKFTQYTLINPKIVSWDHDDVAQSESTKLMRNKMSVVYENVLYNNGRIGKGSRSGIFAEAFYDSSPSPLSIAGKGSLSLFGAGGIIGGIEDVFGENGALAQGNYLAAALQAATLIKNAGQITEEQLSAEGYSMLGAAVGVAVSSKNGEIIQNLQNNFGNSVGVYTNQFTKNNLEDIPTTPVQVFDVDKYVADKYAEKLAAEQARQAQQERERVDIARSQIEDIESQKDILTKQIAKNEQAAFAANSTIQRWSSVVTDPNDTAALQQSAVYKNAIANGVDEDKALAAAKNSAVTNNLAAQTIIAQATKTKDSIYAYNNLLIANQLSFDEQAQLIRDYGSDYATKISTRALEYISTYGVALAKENTLDTNADANPFLNYEIAAKSYLDAVKAGKISPVDKAQIELQSTISQVTGGITTEYSALFKNKDENASQLAGLLIEKAKMDGLKDSLVASYDAWRQSERSPDQLLAVDKELRTADAVLKRYDTTNLEIPDIVNQLKAYSNLENEKINEKLTLIKDHNEQVLFGGGGADTPSSDAFFLNVLKKYDPTYTDAGLLTPADFDKQYVGKVYIFTTSDGKEVLTTRSPGNVYETYYLPAVERGKVVYETAINDLSQQIADTRKEVLYYQIAVDEINAIIDNKYTIGILENSTTGDFYETLVNSINDKTKESGRIQSQITATELLLRRVTINDTSFASGAILLSKELLNNPDPKTPYVILTDARSAAQIDADGKSVQVITKTASFNSPDLQLAKDLARLQLENDFRQKIYGYKDPRDVINLTGETGKVTETVINNKKVYTYTITASTTPPAPVIETTVSVTYITPEGKIKTTAPESFGDTSTARTAADWLQKFKDAGVKVLGVVVNTKNKNTGIRY